jgi:type IV fimbrial biogenesis protein FimT
LEKFLDFTIPFIDIRQLHDSFNRYGGYMGDSVLTDGTAAPQCRRDTGFTVIELMIVTTIVAILLAIAAPSFRYVTTANRASSEINALLGDMQFARAEAIREGQTVTVCATTDQATCVAPGVVFWHTGWLVFSDPTNTAVMAPGTALKIQKTFSSQDTLQADQNVNLVTFSRDGFALSLANPVTFTLHAAANAQYTRCLSLTIVGALSTQISGAQTAENQACL